MSRQRAAALLQIIGTNFNEISEPKDGWNKLHIDAVPKDKIFGKFFIVSNGNINYIHEKYQIENILCLNSSLLDLAIQQLERKCRLTIAIKASKRQFPHLRHLLMKYHELYQSN